MAKPTRSSASGRANGRVKITRALHARRPIVRDPDFEHGLAAHLRKSQTPAELLAVLDRFVDGSTAFDGMMRRVLWRALAKRFGDGVVIGRGVRFTHIETFEIGDGVFISDGAYIQGRHHGRFRVGRKAWIGPHAYFDARDLSIEADVGWGPRAKAICSAHTGLPAAASVISTDIKSRPIRIKTGADIGVGAVVMGGVTVGRGVIIGAGAVVTRNVPAGAVAAGVPARVLRKR